jgi:hypothetical protein
MIGGYMTSTVTLWRRYNKSIILVLSILRFFSHMGYKQQGFKGTAHWTQTHSARLLNTTLAYYYYHTFNSLLLLLKNLIPNVSSAVKAPHAIGAGYQADIASPL